MLTQEEIVAALQQAAAVEGPDVTLWRFKQLTGIHPDVVRRRCGGMRRLRAAAGLPEKINRRQPVYSDDELLEELSRVEGECGRFPSQTDFDWLGRFAWMTISRRFGTRARVLERYHEWQDRRSIGSVALAVTESPMLVEPRIAQGSTNEEETGDSEAAVSPPDLPAEPLREEDSREKPIGLPETEGADSAVPADGPGTRKKEFLAEENLPRRRRWLRERLLQRSREAAAAEQQALEEAGHAGS